MLLALYAGARKSYVAADLARAVGAKPSTALRWQESLETHGLIERSAHPLDSRAHLIQLTEAARRQIESYLEAFGSKDV
jgi:DNA-binding MarR family transcriptional regulator